MGFSASISAVNNGTGYTTRTNHQQRNYNLYGTSEVDKGGSVSNPFGIINTEESCKSESAPKAEQENSSIGDTLSDIALSPFAALKCLFSGDFGLDDFSLMLAYLKGNEYATSIMNTRRSLQDIRNGKVEPDKDVNAVTSIKELIDAGYNPEFAKQFASAAKQNANNIGTLRKCLAGVRKLLEDEGNVSSRGAGTLGEDAKDAVHYLDKDETFKQNFKKVDYKGDLTKLPAGCIVIWDPYTGCDGKLHESGHIAVTLGNGDEASDHVQKLRNRNSKYTVYMPKSSAKTA